MTKLTRQEASDLSAKIDLSNEEKEQLAQYLFEASENVIEAEMKEYWMEHITDELNEAAGSREDLFSIVEMMHSINSLSPEQLMSQKSSIENLLREQLQKDVSEKFPEPKKEKKKGDELLSHYGIRSRYEMKKDFLDKMKKIYIELVNFTFSNFTCLNLEDKEKEVNIEQN